MLKRPGIENLLLDQTVDLAQRKRLLMQLCMDESEAGHESVGKILGAAASAKGESVYLAKLEELNGKIRELEAGPMRRAVFLRVLPEVGSMTRAEVLLDDGSSVYVPVPDAGLAGTLGRGDPVLVEAQGRALVAVDDRPPASGEEARLERRLPGGRVEVAVRGDDRMILRVSSALEDQLDRGEAAPGSRLIVCPRRMFAFEAVPPDDGRSHYRFLSQEAVPDVRPGRDLAKPHPFLERLATHVRIEMSRPELQRKHGVPRCQTVLLAGRSGTGKTYHVMALIRRLYEVMAEATGVAVEDLPPRVLRLRPARMLSKWLGESDRNLDRFFDEVEQLAAEPFQGPDGREHVLPCLAILEECDGIARERGEDAVYDRILTTALQRLDPARPELNESLVIFVSTTNVQRQVDPAFVRRVGGTIERFGKPSRDDVRALLDTLLRARVIRANGARNGEPRRGVVAGVVSWLYAPRQEPEVELSLAGSTAPLPKYCRDFLTASLLDRAVRRASERACREEAGGVEGAGISRESLIEAIREQVRGAAEALHETNAAEYLDLPDGARVVTVRRARRPRLHPVHLERTA